MDTIIDGITISQTVESETAKEFAERAAVPPQRLLKLIKLWRHLQAGSSKKKCPGHSSLE